MKIIKNIKNKNNNNKNEKEKKQSTLKMQIISYPKTRIFRNEALVLN